MRPVRHAALLCVLSLSASWASAASQSSASISNLKYQVYDLTPTDGVLSSYSLSGLPGSMYYNLNDYASGSSENYNHSRAGLTTYNKSVSGELDTVSASIQAGKTALTVEGAATGPGSYSASINGYGYYGTLTLAANSVLIITADALVSASASNPSACASSYYWGCSPSESASASSWMSLSYSFSTPAGSVSGSSSNNISTSAQARGEYSYLSYSGYDFSYPDWYNHPIYTTVVSPAFEQSLSESRSFYAVFANTTNVTQSAYFSLGVSVSGSGTAGALPAQLPAAPVPEPDSLALALAGLVFVGSVMRRRRTA
jgi:hypothetical protein